MSNQKETFSYKGYFGSAEVSQEDECFAGQILYIDDLIMYEGDTYKELEQAFQASVDDYLAFCDEVGKEPQKTYSGSFNIRIGAVLHRQAVRTAALLDISLNEFVRNSIAEGVANGTARSSSRPLIYFGIPHFVSGMTAEGTSIGTSAGSTNFYTPTSNENASSGYSGLLSSTSPSTSQQLPSLKPQLRRVA